MTAMAMTGVHYVEGLEMSGWEQRVAVKKNFDALFMRLGDELRSSIELSDLELQLVLLDAWGLIMRPEDHALLLQVRLFDSLHCILGQTEGDLMLVANRCVRVKTW